MAWILAVGWGGFALVAIALLIIFGGIYGYYARHTRMDITQHPRAAEKEGGGSSRLSGAAPENEGTFDTRGTR
jgi:hypothetical protein